MDKEIVLAVTLLLSALICGGAGLIAVVLENRKRDVAQAQRGPKSAV